MKKFIKSTLHWKLIPNWQEVVLKAISIRWIILGGVFSGAEVALPYLEGRFFFESVPPGLFAAISGLCSCLAFIYRTKAQQELHADVHQQTTPDEKSHRPPRRDRCFIRRWVRHLISGPSSGS